MSEFINTSYAIGDDALVDSIIMRTITEYKENRITFFGRGALSRCTALTVVDVPNITSIDRDAMSNCSALTTLVLRGNTACSLANTNALTGSPIASGTGYIYVPASLIDSYKAATNWSTYADQIRALEDHTVDGTTTGELDETKI